MPEEINHFVPVRRKRVSRLIEEQIKQAIFKGRYPLGGKLPAERELAEMFDASRASIREALRSLERSGLITIRKGVQGGAYIAKGGLTHVVESMVDMFEFGQVSLEHILQARLIIEPPVAAEAAKRATPEDIERLKEANRKLQEGYKIGDPARENVPNTHRVISRITGNKVIRMIMDVLMDVHTLRMSTIKLDDQSKKQILAQHEDIIEAIMKKDPQMAFERMREHILNVHGIHKEIEEGSESVPVEMNKSLKKG
ncbi:MAG: FadR/GntR family transcriptional regulator [Desulfatiglandales bacterium]